MAKDNKDLTPLEVVKETAKVSKLNTNYINNKEFLEELKIYNKYFLPILKKLGNPKDKDLDVAIRIASTSNELEHREVMLEFRNPTFVKVKERLGAKFIKIATNYMNRPSFINYSYDRKSDMISDAVYVMYKYAHKFDTTKDNPFAYFTLMTHNAFIKNITDANIIAETHDSISTLEMLHHQNAQLTDFIDD